MLCPIPHGTTAHTAIVARSISTHQMLLKGQVSEGGPLCPAG